MTALSFSVFLILAVFSAFNCYDSYKTLSTLKNIQRNRNFIFQTVSAEVQKEKSFVQDELRPYAMNLHTRDQSPKEGKQAPQVPFTKWEVSRADYLRFLVDSLKVYETFEDISSSNPRYVAFKNSGLERSEALHKDLEWFLKYDSTLSIPPVGAGGIEYSDALSVLAATSAPRFVCHFYNHYFAHTAGGRMIGKRMSERLLGGHTLHFYQWLAASEGDPRPLLERVRMSIDAEAARWSADERQACLEETPATFAAGARLMIYMKPPDQR